MKLNQDAFLCGFLQGIASIGNVYVTPELSTEYPYSDDIDLQNIGRDMWKAIDIYRDELTNLSLQNPSPELLGIASQDNTGTFEQTNNGPVPPLEVVENYEKVLPGSADRIFVLAEEEQVRRHGRMMDVLITCKIGQWTGFGAVILGIVATVVFAYLDKQFIAGGILATIISGIIASHFKKPPTLDSDFSE